MLSSIGGFKSIANQLADDYQLGELTRRAGLRAVLSNVVVETVVSETTLVDLVQHELGWLRTICAENPHGYRFVFLTLSFPVVALGCVLARGPPAALAMLAMTALFRWLLHLRTRRSGSPGSQILLLPVRDLLSLGLWGWGFVNRRVRWRDSHFDVARDGSAQILEGV